MPFAILTYLPFVQNTYGVWLGSSAVGLKDLARVHLVLCIEDFKPFAILT